jgi:xylulose-5-phosphate/fructose-6-phosphate phosphoketolase
MVSCGDMPTFESPATVSIFREQLPNLKIRVVNGVDFMKHDPGTEYPNGLTDAEFDALFTKDKPDIFVFHGYPKLIYVLSFRLTNYANMDVRCYKEEGI